MSESRRTAGPPAGFAQPPSRKPQEPDERNHAVEAAMGLHLELLGRALRSRLGEEQSQLPSPQLPESTERSASKTKDSSPLGLWEALGRSCNQLMSELDPLWEQKEYDARAAEEAAHAPLAQAVLRLAAPANGEPKADLTGGLNTTALKSETRAPSKSRRQREISSQESQARFASSDDIGVILNSGREARSGRLFRLVTSRHFETLFVILIGVNTIVMICEAQHEGSKLGNTLGFYRQYGSEKHSGQYFLGADTVFEALETSFAGIFTIEAVLRMLGRGRDYWRDALELQDLFVVICSDVTLILPNYAGINIQLFRLLRTVRLLRILRFIRHFVGFDSLSLMTTALHASMWAFLWALVLFVIMQSFWALILSSILQIQYLEGDSLSDDQKFTLFSYFGTYTRSLISMFELSFANWTPLSRFLMENCHEAWMVFSLVYKLTFGFAVIGVMNAVFLQETLKVAETDDDIMVRSRSRSAATHRKKMALLFQSADTNHDGKVDSHEFKRVLKHPSVQTWLESMDLHIGNLDHLWDLISREEEEYMSVDELVHGFAKMKGFARAIDIHIALRAIEERQTASRRISAFQPN